MEIVKGAIGETGRQNRVCGTGLFLKRQQGLSRRLPVLFLTRHTCSCQLSA